MIWIFFLYLLPIIIDFYICFWLLYNDLKETNTGFTLGEFLQYAFKENTLIGGPEQDWSIFFIPGVGLLIAIFLIGVITMDIWWNFATKKIVPLCKKIWYVIKYPFILIKKIYNKIINSILNIKIG